MEGMDQVGDAISASLLKLGLPSGTVEIVAGGRRGPAKNSLIAQVQAARKRDPWYINDDIILLIKSLLHDVIRQQTAFGLGKNLVGPQFLKDVGNLMVLSVQENIRQQKNKDGTTFGELSKRYAEFKRRKFGYTHPILVASRDLIDGIRAVITSTPAVQGSREPPFMDRGRR